MTTQIIESTESSVNLDDNDLLIFFRAGQDDEIRKSWDTVKSEINAETASAIDASSTGTAGMYLRYGASGTIEEVRSVQPIDATDGLPQANSALEGLTAVDHRLDIQYICVKSYNTITEFISSWSVISERSDITVAEYKSEVDAVSGEWLYETSSAFFYIGTTITTGRVEWIQDRASDALAGSVSVAGNDVIFLRSFYQDSNLDGVIVVRKSDTDYMYYNTRVAEFRYLSSFTVAGGAAAYYEWRVIKNDERLVTVIDGRDGAHAVPSPSGLDDNRLRLTNTGLQIVRVYNVSAVNATGSWSTYANDDYVGTFTENPNTSAGSDKFYYNSVHHRWMVSELYGTVYVWVAIPSIDNWIGHYTNRFNALTMVDAGNGSAAFTGAIVEVLSDYVAGTSRVNRVWDSVGGIAAASITDYLTSIVLSGNSLIAYRKDNATSTVNLTPFAGDDYVSSASLTDTTLTLTRADGGTVTVDLAALITNDHINAASLADDILTLTKVSAETVTVDLSDINRVPVGGVVGQVLSKSSGDDYDADWSNLSSSATSSDANYVDITGLNVATYTFSVVGYNHSVNTYTDLGATSALLGTGAEWSVNSSSGSDDVTSEVESTDSILRLNLPRLRPTNDIFGYIIKSSVPMQVGEVEGAITASGTVLTFVSAPDPVLAADDVLYIEEEAVRVVSGSGVSYNINRGHNSTVAVVHDDGDLVYGTEYEAVDEAVMGWGPAHIYSKANVDMSSVAPLNVSSSATVLLLYTSSVNSDAKYMTMRVGGRDQFIPGRAKISVYWAIAGTAESLATDTSEEGTAQTGFNAWQHILWQYSDTEPSDPSVLWGASGFSSEPAPWYRSRDDAKLVADNTASISDDAPVWIAHGRTTRDSSGNYISNPWHVTQEFGVEYSIDGDTNWHSTQADADEFIRFRLVDGDLSGAVRIVSDLRAAAWTLIFQNFVYESTDSSIDFDVNYDLSSFEELRIDVIPFGGYYGGDITGYGNTTSTVIFRPTSGWVVDTSSNTLLGNDGATYMLSYEAKGTSISIVGEIFNSLPTPATQEYVHVSGTAYDVPISLGHYFKFTRNSTDAAEYAREIKSWNFAGTYHRIVLRIYGR